MLAGANTDEIGSLLSQAARCAVLHRCKAFWHVYRACVRSQSDNCGWSMVSSRCTSEAGETLHGSLQAPSLSMEYFTEARITLQRTENFFGRFHVLLAVASRLPNLLLYALTASALRNCSDKGMGLLSCMSRTP